MSFTDKIKFWKKHDDLGLEDDFGAEMKQNQMRDDGTRESFVGEGGQEIKNDLSNPLSFEEKSKFEQPQQNFGQQNYQQSSRDFDLISSKLDTIKAELDSINQRIQKIEKIAEESQKEEKKKDSLW
ncbi:MAG: hypothetical protein ABH828_01375 [archaeon]